MDRRVYGRLVWLVTCLTILSFFSVLITDLNFYVEKMKENPARQTESDEESANIYDVPEIDQNTLLNNFGDNINLKVDKQRQKNATESDLKYILFWNEAYGSKE